MNSYKGSGFSIDTDMKTRMMRDAVVSGLKKYIRTVIEYDGEVDVWYSSINYGQRIAIHVGPPFNIEVPEYQDNGKTVETLLKESYFYQIKVKSRQRVKSSRRFGIPKQTIRSRR